MHYEKQVLERHELANGFRIQGLVVNGKSYDLRIFNTGEEGRLSLAFCKPGSDEHDFIIQILNGQMRFHRSCYRPNHDHDDSQGLQQMPDGKLQWYERFPYTGEGRGFFEVPFGAVEVGY